MFEDGKLESLNKFSNNEDMSCKVIKKLQDVNSDIKKEINISKKIVRLSREWNNKYLLKDIKNLKLCELQIRELDKEFNSKLRDIDVVKALLIKVVYDVKNDKRFMINNTDRIDINIRKNMDMISEMYSQIIKVLEASYKKIDNTITELKVKI